MFSLWYTTSFDIIWIQCYHCRGWNRKWNSEPCKYKLQQHSLQQLMTKGLEVWGSSQTAFAHLPALIQASISPLITQSSWKTEWECSLISSDITDHFISSKSNNCWSYLAHSIQKLCMNTIFRFGHNFSLYNYLIRTISSQVLTITKPNA